MPYFEIISSLCVGIIIGLVIAKATQAKNESGKLKGKLLAKEAEIEQYKNHVSEHFNTTEDLLIKLSDDYVALQQHLAENAKNLLDNVELADIPFQTKDVSGLEAPIEGQPKDYSLGASGLLNK